MVSKKKPAQEKPSPTHLQVELGRVLRSARKASKITQGQLGDECECDQSTISGIERAKLWPSPELLRRIADALHTQVYLLFEEAEKRTGEPLTREAAMVGRKWQNAPPHERAAFSVLLDRLGDGDVPAKLANRRPEKSLV